MTLSLFFSYLARLKTPLLLRAHEGYFLEELEGEVVLLLHQVPEEGHRVAGHGDGGLVAALQEMSWKLC